MRKKVLLAEKITVPERGSGAGGFGVLGSLRRDDRIYQNYQRVLVKGGLLHLAMN